MALANYLELSGSAGCDSLLPTLVKKGNLNEFSSKESSQHDGKVITTIKFSDYKRAMLNYLSEKEFEKNWTNKLYFSEDNDGYLIKAQGGGGYREYSIKSFAKTDNLTYTANVTSVVDGSDYFQENNVRFVISSLNGKCVIDSLEWLN